MPRWSRSPTIAAIHDTDDIDSIDDISRSVPLRVRRGLVVFSVAFAALGVWWYVTDPGVLSYQLGGLATIPFAVVVLVRLHRRLATAVQWALALVLAIAGPVAYVLWPSATLWNYGALAVMPLCMLAWRRTAGHPDAPPPAGAPDGPWGPP